MYYAIFLLLESIRVIRYQHLRVSDNLIVTRSPGRRHAMFRFAKRNQAAYPELRVKNFGVLA